MKPLRNYRRDREGTIVYLVEETQKRQRLLQGKNTNGRTGILIQISNTVSWALPPKTRYFPISYQASRKRKALSCPFSLFETEEIEFPQLGLIWNELESELS